MRPNFIAICQPDYARPGAIIDQTYNSKYGPRFASVAKACTQKDKATLRFAMEAFPSGHTASAFVVGVFLSLYLNAKLKAFSDYHTSFWKMMIVMIPTVVALIAASTLTIDHVRNDHYPGFPSLSFMTSILNCVLQNHHAHDILLSTLIGVIVALLAYRSHYASIFNYRTNHIYLPWSSSHRSLVPTEAPPAYDLGTNQRRYRFCNRKNMTAVAWPRRPYPNAGVTPDHPHQKLGTTNAQGLDGASAVPPPGPVAVAEERPAVPRSLRSRKHGWRFQAFRGSFRRRDLRVPTADVDDADHEDRIRDDTLRREPTHAVAAARAVSSVSKTRRARSGGSSRASAGAMV